ncbi:MAG TPA: type II toxin-antitoxin system RelE/ParE family toxin [Candidatus Angelobacter sp.]|jgi:hypothetical protein
MASDNPFDWTNSGTSSFANLEPANEEIDGLDSHFEKILQDDCGRLKIPLYFEQQQLFLVQYERFGIVFFFASDQAHILRIIHWGDWLG